MKTSGRAWLGPDPSCSPAGRCQMLLVCVEVYLRSRRVGLKYGTECSIESHTEQDEPLMPAMLTDLQQTSAAQGSSQQDGTDQVDIHNLSRSKVSAEGQRQLLPLLSNLDHEAKTIPHDTVTSTLKPLRKPDRRSKADQISGAAHHSHPRL